VSGTSGAELHPGRHCAAAGPRRRQGRDADVDAYSAFDGTDLAAWLAARGVDEIVLGGLATDYCVRASALDGLGAGFAVTVAADACRPVEVLPGDGERALEEIRAAGGRVATTAELLATDG
jgi:nicotinamidase/pyrazinamidase